jgi:hypothetical protein
VGTIDTKKMKMSNGITLIGALKGKHSDNDNDNELHLYSAFI